MSDDMTKNASSLAGGAKRQVGRLALHQSVTDTASVHVSNLTPKTLQGLDSSRDRTAKRPTM